MNVNWKAQAGNELARARKSLRAARVLLGVRLFEDAVSRAYYAVLHAAKAALATGEISPKSHSGVSRLLGERLVKPGWIEADYARIFSVQQDDREFCDYESSASISSDKAELRVAEAEKFVDRMARYMKEHARTKVSLACSPEVESKPGMVRERGVRYGARKRMTNAER